MCFVNKLLLRCVLGRTGGTSVGLFSQPHKPPRLALDFGQLLLVQLTDPPFEIAGTVGR